jgi:hypothetical protein
MNHDIVSFIKGIFGQMLLYSVQLFGLFVVCFFYYLLKDYCQEKKKDFIK